MKILISKKNQIGDMVLGLPLATFIKQAQPDYSVYFLGKDLNQTLVNTYADADGFVNLTTLLSLPEQEQIAELHRYHFDAILHVTPDAYIGKVAKKAGVPIRVGTRIGIMQHIPVRVFVVSTGSTRTLS